MAVKVALEIDEETYNEVKDRLELLNGIARSTNGYVERSRRLLAVNGAIMSLFWFVLGATFGFLATAALLP